MAWDYRHSKVAGGLVDVATVAALIGLLALIYKLGTPAPPN